MRSSVLEIIAAHAHSSRFTGFAHGIPVCLPTGETVVAKLEAIYRSERPEGLRLSKYAFSCGFSIGDHQARGFGEAEHKLVAVQKCIAEGFERAIYHAVKETPYRAPNSNGWAAHLSKALAHSSALNELLERDAVLVHWLTQTPLTEISLGSAPAWLRRWLTSELPLGSTFKSLRVLVSSLGYRPSVTTVLLDQDGFAVMSHATAGTLESATYKALAETCRIAQLAQERNFVESSRLLLSQERTHKVFPEDHALLYAHHEKFPIWVFGDRHDWTICSRDWKRRVKGFDPRPFSHEFHEVLNGPLVVGYCTSDQVQNLYFGRTEKAQKNGLINVGRLKDVMHARELNLMPHFVA